MPSLFFSFISREREVREKREQRDERGVTSRERLLSHFPSFRFARDMQPTYLERDISHFRERERESFALHENIIEASIYMSMSFHLYLYASPFAHHYLPLLYLYIYINISYIYMSIYIYISSYIYIYIYKENIYIIYIYISSYIYFHITHLERQRGAAESKRQERERDAVRGRESVTFISDIIWDFPESFLWGEREREKHHYLFEFQRERKRVISVMRERERERQRERVRQRLKWERRVRETSSFHLHFILYSLPERKHWCRERLWERQRERNTRELFPFI